MLARRPLPAKPFAVAAGGRLRLAADVPATPSAVAAGGPLRLAADVPATPFAVAAGGHPRLPRAPWRLIVLVVAAPVLLLGPTTPAGAQQAPEPPPAPSAPAPTPPAPAEPGADVATPGDEPDGGAGGAGQGLVPAVPEVTIGVDSGDAALSRTVVIVLLLTVGSIAPGLLLLMTTFTRFVVVLGLAKNALALQTIPPAQVLVGLALFLSWFVMAPVLGQVNEQAVQPLLAGEVGQQQALADGFAPIRDFMLAQTRESDLELFMSLSGAQQPASVDDVAASTLIPAFVVSELRAAFVIGFVIFVPFLVIDLVVAAVLMSMGMVMLPPVFISLPLKLLLFVLVDGWALIVGSLVNSVVGVGA